MKEIVIRIITDVSVAILVGGILWILRSQIWIVINLLFKRFYPSIVGRWLITERDVIYFRGSKKEILVIKKQFGNRISGDSEQYIDNKLIRTIRLDGKISSSRIFTFAYQTLESEPPNFATGIFKLESNSTHMRGGLTRICPRCSSGTFFFRLELEKISKLT